jgi:hypothetical protein
MQHSGAVVPLFLLLWLSIPSGFLVVFQKPNRSSFTSTLSTMATLPTLIWSPTVALPPLLLLGGAMSAANCFATTDPAGAARAGSRVHT